MNEYTLCTLKRKNDIAEKQVIIYLGLKSTFFIQYPNQMAREAIWLRLLEILKKGLTNIRVFNSLIYWTPIKSQEPF